jgi:hypothetical protein
MNCKNPDRFQPKEGDYKIIFLHHSTGQIVWTGKPQGMNKIKNIFSKVSAVPDWFEQYNKAKGTNYFIREQNFPKGNPYPWDNYPYDYYNIWIKNAGSSPYMEEPTLEMLTSDYDLIIFKHCYPVGLIEDDTGDPIIGSNEKRLENYKLQYEALREKLHEFPEKLFLLWTGAANVKSQTNPDYAARTRMFFDWVKNEWDIEGDNIFLWDFYELETEGGLYLTENNARNSNDSHPSVDFGARVALLFCERIVDIIETNGQKTTLTGLPK